MLDRLPLPALPVLRGYRGRYVKTVTPGIDKITVPNGPGRTPRPRPPRPAGRALRSPGRRCTFGSVAPYKLPRVIERATAPLRDDAGKVRRSALRVERLAR